VLSGMLGYPMDINFDEYLIILKSGNRFLFFYDILKGITIDFKNKNKNNRNRLITNRWITGNGGSKK